MFPGVDEEAVEAAEYGEEDGGGQECRKLGGIAGDGGDEDGGGKEEANGDLLWQAVRLVGGVDDEEPRDEKSAFDEVEADGGWVEAWQQVCED